MMAVLEKRINIVLDDYHNQNIDMHIAVLNVMARAIEKGDSKMLTNTAKQLQKGYMRRKTDIKETMRKNFKNVK